MDTAKSERIYWIDALKGWGIIFMMYGHIEFAPRFLKQYTSPVMLVVFFVAAGYTFRSGQDFKSFLVKKIRTLLWPWFLFASLNILLTQVLTFSEQEPLADQFLDLFIQVRGKTDGLWFFPCMFMSIILYYWLNRIIKSKSLFYAVNFLLLCASLAFIRLTGIALPWHIQIWGAACFYMAIGTAYREHEDTLRPIFTRKGFLVTMFIGFTASWWLSRAFYPDTQYNFYHCEDSVLFYSLGMAFGIAGMLSFVQVLPSLWLTEYAGRNSLMYFAFHGKPKRLFTVLLQKYALVSAGNETADLLWSLGDIAVLAAILVIPCKIVIRWLPWMLGKRIKS